MRRRQPPKPGIALLALAAVVAAAWAASAARAAVLGVTLTGATLYILEGVDPALVGTLDPATGAYTAPSVPGTYHIIAASNDDPNVVDTTTITVEALAPTTHTFIWPLPDPPLVSSLVRIDDIGPPGLIKDNHGAGDLFGVYHEWHGSHRWLLTSQDDGQTWRYVALPGDTNPRPASDPAADVTAQDSAGDVHHAWVYYLRAYIQYSRLVLARDAAGHITGGTWAVSNQDGPWVSTAQPGEYRLYLIVANPGTPSECLVLGFVDNPTPAPPYGTGNGYGRYQIAMTANLAPAGPSSWLKLDGTPTGTGPGPAATLVKAYTSADTHVQDLPLLAGQVDPTSVVTPIGSTANVHQSTLVLEQHPVDGSLHYLIGPRNTENVKTGLDIRRWRFVPSGAGWTLDPAWSTTDQQLGKLVASTSTLANPNIGALFKGTTRLWFTAYRTSRAACMAAGVTTCENGLVIDALDANDVYTFNAVPSPQTTTAWPKMWGGYAVISSDPTDTRLWVLWSRFGTGIATDGDWGGSYDGATKTWDDIHQYAPEELGGCHAYSGTAAWRGGLAVIAGYKDPTFNNLRVRPYVAAIRTR